MALDILDKKTLNSMTLFNKYINKLSCPTDFALATGLISYSNKEHMVCSSYFVDDDSDVYPAHVLKVSHDGFYRFGSKLDKSGIGIRPAIYSTYINTDLVISGDIINEDLSVMEYGYYPKSLIELQYEYQDFGVKIRLPKSVDGKKPEYVEYPVFYNPKTDIYFVEYPVSALHTKLGNKVYTRGQKATFKIEPVRFWVDNNSGICISQDVIEGGIPYKMEEPYGYNDYYESDLCEGVSIIEENMIILHKMINMIGKQKKKEKNS